MLLDTILILGHAAKLSRTKMNVCFINTDKYKAAGYFCLIYQNNII